MSYSFDVNILLYAADQNSSRNERALQVLRQAVEGTEIVGIAWPTIMAFLRIATNPRIFENPLAPVDAHANIENLIQFSNIRLLSEEDGFWNIYRQVTRGISVRGNLVPDAHIAAILKQHGVDTIYTNDSDFKKFDFLRCRNPFD